MNNNDKEQKRFLDITIQINLTFWASLIAINGITIAGFAIIATSYNFNLLLSLMAILPSVISCFLIIDNFLLAKKQYEILGHIDSNQEITDEKKESDINDARHKKQIIDRHNNITLILIFLQILFFIIFINHDLSASAFNWFMRFFVLFFI